MTEIAPFTTLLRNAGFAARAVFVTTDVEQAARAVRRQAEIAGVPPEQAHEFESRGRRKSEIVVARLSACRSPGPRLAPHADVLLRARETPAWKAELVMKSRCSETPVQPDLTEPLAAAVARMARDVAEMALTSTPGTRWSLAWEEAIRDQWAPAFLLLQFVEPLPPAFPAVALELFVAAAGRHLRALEIAGADQTGAA